MPRHLSIQLMKAAGVRKCSAARAFVHSTHCIWCFNTWFGAGLKSSIFGVLAAPAVRKPFPTDRPLRGPPVGRGFRAAGFASTPKVDDFRPAPKHCIRNPSVRFLEWRSVFSSGEAFSRVEKRFLEWRSVSSSGEAFSRVEKTLPLSRRRFPSRENASPLEKTLPSREDVCFPEKTLPLSRKRFPFRENIALGTRVCSDA